MTNSQTFDSKITFFFKYSNRIPHFNKNNDNLLLPSLKITLPADYPDKPVIFAVFMFANMPQ